MVEKSEVPKINHAAISKGEVAEQINAKNTEKLSAENSAETSCVTNSSSPSSKPNVTREQLHAVVMCDSTSQTHKKMITRSSSSVGSVFNNSSSSNINADTQNSQNLQNFGKRRNSSETTNSSSNNIVNSSKAMNFSSSKSFAGITSHELRRIDSETEKVRQLLNQDFRDETQKNLCNNNSFADNNSWNRSESLSNRNRNSSTNKYGNRSKLAKKVSDGTSSNYSEILRDVESKLANYGNPPVHNSSSLCTVNNSSPEKQKNAVAICKKCEYTNVINNPSCCHNSCTTKNSNSSPDLSSSARNNNSSSDHGSEMKNKNQADYPLPEDPDSCLFDAENSTSTKPTQPTSLVSANIAKFESQSQLQNNLMNSNFVSPSMHSSHLSAGSQHFPHPRTISPGSSISRNSRSSQDNVSQIGHDRCSNCCTCQHCCDNRVDRLNNNLGVGGVGGFGGLGNSWSLDQGTNSWRLKNLPGRVSSQNVATTHVLRTSTSNISNVKRLSSTDQEHSDDSQLRNVMFNMENNSNSFTLGRKSSSLGQYGNKTPCCGNIMKKSCSLPQNPNRSRKNSNSNVFGNSPDLQNIITNSRSLLLGQHILTSSAGIKSWNMNRVDVANPDNLGSDVDNGQNLPNAQILTNLNTITNSSNLNGISAEMGGNNININMLFHPQTQILGLSYTRDNYISPRSSCAVKSDDTIDFTKSTDKSVLLQWQTLRSDDRGPSSNKTSPTSGSPTIRDPCAMTCHSRGLIIKSNTSLSNSPKISPGAGHVHTTSSSTNIGLSCVNSSNNNLGANTESSIPLRKYYSTRKNMTLRGGENSFSLTGKDNVLGGANLSDSNYDSDDENYELKNQWWNQDDKDDTSSSNISNSPNNARTREQKNSSIKIPKLKKNSSSESSQSLGKNSNDSTSHGGRRSSGCSDGNSPPNHTPNGNLRVDSGHVKRVGFLSNSVGKINNKIVESQTSTSFSENCRQKQGDEEFIPQNCLSTTSPTNINASSAPGGASSLNILESSSAGASFNTISSRSLGSFPLKRQLSLVREVSENGSESHSTGPRASLRRSKSGNTSASTCSKSVLTTERERGRLSHGTNSMSTNAGICSMSSTSLLQKQNSRSSKSSTNLRVSPTFNATSNTPTRTLSFTESTTQGELLLGEQIVRHIFNKGCHPTEGKYHSTGTTVPTEERGISISQENVETTCREEGSPTQGGKSTTTISFALGQLAQIAENPCSQSSTERTRSNNTNSINSNTSFSGLTTRRVTLKKISTSNSTNLSNSSKISETVQKNISEMVAVETRNSAPTTVISSTRDKSSSNNSAIRTTGLTERSNSEKNFSTMNKALCSTNLSLPNFRSSSRSSNRSTDSRSTKKKIPDWTGEMILSSQLVSSSQQSPTEMGGHVKSSRVELSSSCRDSDTSIFPNGIIPSVVTPNNDLVPNQQTLIPAIFSETLLQKISGNNCEETIVNITSSPPDEIISNDCTNVNVTPQNVKCSSPQEDVRLQRMQKIQRDILCEDINVKTETQTLQQKSSPAKNLIISDKKITSSDVKGLPSSSHFQNVTTGETHGRKNSPASFSNNDAFVPRLENVTNRAVLRTASGERRESQHSVAKMNERRELERHPSRVAKKKGTTVLTTVLSDFSQMSTISEEEAFQEDVTKRWCTVVDPKDFVQPLEKVKVTGGTADFYKMTYLPGRKPEHISQSTNATGGSPTSELCVEDHIPQSEDNVEQDVTHVDEDRCRSSSHKNTQQNNKSSSLNPQIRDGDEDEKTVSTQKILLDTTNYWIGKDLAHAKHESCFYEKIQPYISKPETSLSRKKFLDSYLCECPGSMRGCDVMVFDEESRLLRDNSDELMKQLHSTASIPLNTPLTTSVPLKKSDHDHGEVLSRSTEHVTINMENVEKTFPPRKKQIGSSSLFPGSALSKQGSNDSTKSKQNSTSIKDSTKNISSPEKTVPSPVEETAANVITPGPANKNLSATHAPDIATNIATQSKPSPVSILKKSAQNLVPGVPGEEAAEQENSTSGKKKILKKQTTLSDMADVVLHNLAKENDNTALVSLTLNNMKQIQKTTSFSPHDGPATNDENAIYNFFGKSMKIEKADILVMKNLLYGFRDLRMADIKMGKKTAVADWLGKTEFRAWYHSKVDELSNSGKEGYRLEGFTNAPHSFKNFVQETPGDMVAGLAEIFKGGSQRDKFLQQLLNTAEILRFFLDTRGICRKSTSSDKKTSNIIKLLAEENDLDDHHREYLQKSEELHKVSSFGIERGVFSTRKDEHYAKYILLTLVTKLVGLVDGISQMEAPQQWIGSSVGVGFETELYSSNCEENCEDQSEAESEHLLEQNGGEHCEEFSRENKLSKKKVSKSNSTKKNRSHDSSEKKSSRTSSHHILNRDFSDPIFKIFDWGRSEFNTLENHKTLHPKDQKSRIFYHRQYLQAAVELLYRSSRVFLHRFCSNSWKTLVIELEETKNKGVSGFLLNGDKRHATRVLGTVCIPLFAEKNCDSSFGSNSPNSTSLIPNSNSNLPRSFSNSSEEETNPGRNSPKSPLLKCGEVYDIPLMDCGRNVFFSENENSESMNISEGENSPHTNILGEVQTNRAACGTQCTSTSVPNYGAAATTTLNPPTTTHHRRPKTTHNDRRRPAEDLRNEKHSPNMKNQRATIIGNVQVVFHHLQDASRVSVEVKSFSTEDSQLGNNQNRHCRLKVMAFEFPQDAENYCRGIWDSKETGGRKFVTEQKVQKGKCSARETCYLSFSNNSSKNVPEDGTYVHRSSTRSIDGQRKVVGSNSNTRKKQNAVHTTFSNIDSSAACAMHRDAGRESEAEESGFFHNGGLQGRDASDESNKSTNNKITKNEETQETLVDEKTRELVEKISKPKTCSENNILNCGKNLHAEHVGNSTNSCPTASSPTSDIVNSSNKILGDQTTLGNGVTSSKKLAFGHSGSIRRQDSANIRSSRQLLTVVQEEENLVISEDNNMTQNSSNGAGRNSIGNTIQSANNISSSNLPNNNSRNNKGSTNLRPRSVNTSSVGSHKDTRDAKGGRAGTPTSKKANTSFSQSQSVRRVSSKTVGGGKVFVAGFSSSSSSPKKSSSSSGNNKNSAVNAGTVPPEIFEFLVFKNSENRNDLQRALNISQEKILQHTAAIAVGKKGLDIRKILLDDENCDSPNNLQNFKDIVFDENGNLDFKKFGQKIVTRFKNMFGNMTLTTNLGAEEAAHNLGGAANSPINREGSGSKFSNSSSENTSNSNTSNDLLQGNVVNYLSDILENDGEHCSGNNSTEPHDADTNIPLGNTSTSTTNILNNSPVNCSRNQNQQVLTRASSQQTSSPQINQRSAAAMKKKATPRKFLNNSSSFNKSNSNLLSNSSPQHQNSPTQQTSTNSPVAHSRPQTQNTVSSNNSSSNANDGNSNTPKKGKKKKMTLQQKLLRYVSEAELKEEIENLWLKIFPTEMTDEPEIDLINIHWLGEHMTNKYFGQGFLYEGKNVPADWCPHSR